MGDGAHQPGLHTLELPQGMEPTSRSYSEPTQASPSPAGPIGSLGRLLYGLGESCLSGGLGWNFQRCGSGPTQPSSPHLPWPEPPLTALAPGGPVARAAGHRGTRPWSAQTPARVQTPVPVNTAPLPPWASVSPLGEPAPHCPDRVRQTGRTWEWGRDYHLYPLEHGSLPSPKRLGLVS